MARRKQPINAGVPADRSPEAEQPAAAADRQAPAAGPPAATPPSPPPQSPPTPEPATRPGVDKPVDEDPSQKPARKPVPLALKAIGGIILLAVVFILAAILGGRGSQSSETPPGAAAPISDGGSHKSEAPSDQTAEELGYPAFATKNTTRIGGADPVANAAGVALATFPSATQDQRPIAVTLVDEDDWQGAIAASVLMAAPIKAPVLISTAGDLPEPTSKAFAALDPLGSGATLGAQAFLIGDVAAPSGLLHVKHVKAGEPAVTAAAIQRVRDQLLGAPKHIVIASAEDAAYAMPAAAWAARSGDPVLFTESDKLPAATAKALRRYAEVPIYVLGPSSAISSGVVREIAKIDSNVRRVAGEDPVSSSIALARYAGGDFGWNVNDPGHGFVVARSDSPLDAAAAAPLSASGTWGPLLLTDSADTLPLALREYLLDVKPGYTTNPTRAFYNHVWIVGDQEAISVNQQAEIDDLAELTKIGGE